MSTNSAPSFYSKANVYPTGIGGASVLTSIPWVKQFEDAASAGICVLTQDEGPRFPAGLYVLGQQVTALPEGSGVLTWRFALAFTDICTMVTNGAVLSLYLSVTASLSFGGGYIVYRNGQLQGSAALVNDPSSVWLVSYIAVAGGTGTVTSVSGVTPDVGGNVPFASTNLTDSSSLLRTAQKGAASGVASLDGSSKVPLAQISGVIALSNLSDGAAQATAITNAGNAAAAAQTTANAAIPATQKGAASGVATLDGSSKVPLVLISAVLALSNLTDGATQQSAITASTNFAATKGAASGLAPLDSGSKVPLTNINSVLALANLTDGAAQQAAITANSNFTASKGVANGVASLDGTGKVPAGQLPATSNAVTSVASRTGAIVLTSADLTDLAATITTPISNAQATANAAIPSTQRGAASGVASLDSGTKVPLAQISGVLALANLSDGTTQQSAITANTNFVASKGVANGVAGLDGTGKVPASQLPASSAGTVFDLFNGSSFLILPVRNATTFTYIGISSVGNVGALTARTTQLAGIGYVVRVNVASTATANTNAYLATATANTPTFMPDTGTAYPTMRMRAVFAVSDALTGCRTGAGYTQNVPVGTTEPSTQFNTAWFAADSTDTQLTFMTNAGSGTATKTVLNGGTGFPANTNATDVYDTYIELIGGATRSIYYYIINRVTGVKASGTVTTTLPVALTPLISAVYRNTAANVTAASLEFIALAGGGLAQMGPIV